MEIFFALLEIFVIFYVGYKVGETVAMARFLDLFKKLSGKEFNTDDIDNVVEETNSIELFETETLGDIIYLYSVEDHKFICQANTLEDICKKGIEYTKLQELIIIHDKEAYSYNGKVLEKIKK